MPVFCELPVKQAHWANSNTCAMAK